MRAFGSSQPRIDAAAKVTGAALYPGDIDLPGQAWLKIVFAGMPHARIRAMDTRAAASAPGVVSVLTAADVPVNEYGLIMPDQPVLCGPDSTPQAAIVRWEADHVAVVVAETKAQAEAAAELIAIDAELLPVVTDPRVAMAPDAPILHPYPFRYPYGERPLDSNVLLEYRLKQGDIAAGFAAAAVIVESTYHTHAQEHAYLQPEAGLAFVRPDGRIEVICGGQWMHEDQEQIAHALGMAADRIVVRYPAIGGAFGGREDLSVQIALALAAWKTGRPVKTVWSREESIIGHHKRHPFTIWARWGATRDGKIIAAQMDATSDCGAYACTSTKVLGNALMSLLGPYAIPNVDVVARTVYTNNTPSGAFRGFGGPQGHFAAEMQVNKLAEQLAMDPVELRLRNLWREGSFLPSRAPLPAGVTVVETLEAALAHHVQTPTAGRQPPLTPSLSSLDATRGAVAQGSGLAVCFKNVGFSLGAPESCHAVVEIYGDQVMERAIVRCVGAEVGQGAHTVFQRMAAEGLGIDPALVEVRADDTDDAGSSGSASASRMSFMAGNAIKGAAERALQAWNEEERPARAEFVYHPRPTTRYDAETGAADPHITYGYCTQIADVTVDLETGHVTVDRIVSANDVGNAINPPQIEGQIEGALAQSVGWTLLENYVQREGRAVTQHFSTYLIPGVWDVAAVVEPVILEYPDPQGPFGVRGMAEMPFIPTAPAIAAAIHAATGIWLDELPFTPERVWQALQTQRKSN